MSKARIVYQCCLAVLVMLSAGCTTADKPLNLPNGAVGYHIYCGGMPFSDANDCLDRAKTRCGDAGYTVIKQNDPAYAHTERVWDLTTRDIVVQCNSNPHDIVPEQ